MAKAKGLIHNMKKEHISRHTFKMYTTFPKAYNHLSIRMHRFLHGEN